MRNLIKSLTRLLNVAVKDIGLTAEPPFVTVTFSIAELRSLIQEPQCISEVLAKCFVRRRVFWEDIRKESIEGVVKSLVEVESELDWWTTKLAASSDLSVVALTKFVRSWSTATSLVRKELGDRLRDIDDEKSSVPGYDSANEDRHTEVHNALVALRRRVYPLVSALVAFLPDDDPTKDDAQSRLDSGLSLVPDAAIQRGCIPVFDEFE